MVEMDLLGVRLELPANTPVVLLREQSGERVLPIYIGPEEAKAIAVALEGMVMPRPMTHDLLRDVLGAMGATLTRVTVTELRDRTFYAELELRQDGRTFRVSSRPSDAIALAVRADAKIYVADEVIDDSAIEFNQEPEDSGEVIDEFKKFLENVTPEDFGN